MREQESRSFDLLLVCDAGGHLFEMFSLGPVWRRFRHAWVTTDQADARELLRGEMVFFAYGPTRRSVRSLLRNTALAWRVLRAVRPKAVLATGAGVTVPFAWMARLLGVDVIYFECAGRIGISLSGRLVRPIADHFFVQWPDVAEQTGTTYAGSVLIPTADR